MSKTPSSVLYATINSHPKSSRTSNQCLLPSQSPPAHKTPRTSLTLFTFPIPNPTSNRPSADTTIPICISDQHSQPAMNSGNVRAEYSQWRGQIVNSSTSSLLSVPALRNTEIRFRHRSRACCFVVDSDNNNTRPGSDSGSDSGTRHGEWVWNCDCDCDCDWTCIRSNMECR